jgi:hypothetical protein
MSLPKDKSLPILGLEVAAPIELFSDTMLWRVDSKIGRMNFKEYTVLEVEFGEDNRTLKVMLYVPRPISEKRQKPE